MTGVCGSSAVRMSVTASSSWYSTRTCSAASSAAARLVATTAATASPCQQTRSMAMALLRRGFQAFQMREHTDPRRDDGGKFFARNDGDNARQALRRADLNCHDPGMCMRRAQEHQMRHAREFHVADIEPAPLHQPIEIRPRHRLADVGVRPVEHRKRLATCQPPGHHLRSFRERAVVSIASTMA